MRVTLAFLRALARVEKQAAADRAAARDAIHKWGEQVAQRLAAEKECRRLRALLRDRDLDLEVSNAAIAALEPDVAELAEYQRRFGHLMEVARNIERHIAEGRHPSEGFDL